MTISMPPVPTIVGRVRPAAHSAPSFDRLLRAAERHTYDPFAEVDWSTPIDDSCWHLPVEYLPLYGTPTWESMDDRERRVYSRHECAALQSAAIWLENRLMSVLVRYLYRLPPDHPAHRYLLVELADECRHSAMFGEYVRRAGTPPYRPSARLLLEGDVFQRTQGLTSSFIGVLAAEELIDMANRATMRTADIHPTARRVAEIHVAEETRHRSYAKSFIRQQWPILSRRERLMTAVSAPVITFAIAEALVNPAVYRAVGLPGGYWVAVSNPRYWQRIAADLASFTGFLTEVGVITPLSRPLWLGLGLTPGREPTVPELAAAA
jgi:hypothetical protein